MALSCGLPHAPRAMANAGARAGHTPPAPGDGGAGQEPGARGARRGRGPRGVAGSRLDLRTGAVRNARHTRHTRLETHEHTSTRTQHATKNKSEKTPSQDTLLAHERGEGSDQVQRSWVKTRGIGAVRSGGLAALLVALASAAAREQLLRALEDERRPVEL